MTEPARDQAAILVVDDRPDQLVALDAILTPLGQPVVDAASGEDALRHLLKRDFAVILLDERMSGMSGLETARLIKSRERTRFIPIIFITGMDNREETVIARAYLAGAVDYVFKPVQPDILRSKVSVFVELYRQQRRLAAQEQGLRAAERQREDLEHAQEMLQSEARYREILEAALDAIVILDADGRISMINRAAERMFGVTANEAVGTSVDRFFANTPERVFSADECVSADQAAGVTSSRRPVEPRAYMARRADGETFPSEVSVSCLDGTAKRRYTLIARDVTERVRQAEALQEAMAARSRFFAAMSHELRTPINAVLGYNALLLEGIYGPLNEQQADGIGRSQRATQHLLELVNDVLDLSKLDAGKMDITLESIGVPGVIHEVASTVQPLAEKKGSTISVDHLGEPITIVSDSRRVRQILLNLFSNAIKFGQGKPIRAVSKPRVAADGGQGVTIAVVDQGIGIAPEDKVRVFEEFERAGKPGDSAGTGLGLAISRRLAETLGGSLDVESERGKGSTFTLTLPAVSRSS